MSIPLESLETELLRLPTAERARLLDRVVASLDADADRDRAWDAIAASRDAEISDGTAAEVDGLAFTAQLREELK
ncbi:addiction module protein [Pseudorhodoferax sp. Leaf274]|uniref:addiction module protein n=1 Tax=Pseudorhodoferax sp. Leaf274 TaxID=1736318 RepID=UPI00070356E4|nr:addiction module protein [Pseudorhodoferax sp. Leaf274]KQP36173.1 hypothetical protein ASF44_16535 [Pseudorhodoferax sp. Leaf274]